ncbi:hypothetical protein [Bifidobacterium jacchi]|uniref:Uncharacterized protein n=1 Tax=Bifidobacterium jacchi TaxID=2490545 RepID=A0A5N5RKY6_9BIFI|nr:hypothetical protein [Bifidobacterium jacchi]KAB5607954.1 hypothetical protein EHS19_03245 [Bifidobacterium jacchi]
MRAARSLGLRAAAAVAAAALMLVAPACGNRHDIVRSHADSHGARIAASLQDYATVLLSNNGSGMGDAQKSAVKHVAETGKVSVSDYETGLSGYRQCMLDRGYKEILFVDIGKGLKAEAPYAGGTDVQNKKYIEDRVNCELIHSGSISSLYEKQTGNPSLIKDHYEAIADCLRRANLVDASYTGKQYKTEYEAYLKGDSQWPYSFSEQEDSAVRVCEYSNGYLRADSDWPLEHVW